MTSLRVRVGLYQSAMPQAAAQHAVADRHDGEGEDDSDSHRPQADLAAEGQARRRDRSRGPTDTDLHVVGAFGERGPQSVDSLLEGCREASHQLGAASGATSSGPVKAFPTLVSVTAT